MKTLVQLILFSLIANSTIAADWLYTEHYPWVWDQTNGWNYIPESSDQVWNKASQSWVLNPYGTPVDLSVLQSTQDWRLNILEPNGTDSYIGIQFSGNEKRSSFLYFSFSVFQTIKFKYSTIINQLNGTALIHIQSISEVSTDNFSLLLNFTSATSGTYQLVGNLSENFTSPPSPVQLTGAFTAHY